MMRALFLVAGLAWGAMAVAPGARQADAAGKMSCDSSSEPERSSLRISAHTRKLAVRSGARVPPLVQVPVASAAACSTSRLFQPDDRSEPTLRPGEHLIARAAPRGPPSRRA
jgi:hypothetical protein